MELKETQIITNLSKESISQREDVYSKLEDRSTES